MYHAGGLCTTRIRNPPAKKLYVRPDKQPHFKVSLLNNNKLRPAKYFDKFVLKHVQLFVKFYDL